MIQQINPDELKKKSPNRYKVAEEEVRTDLLHAQKYGISDFEITIEGMKPEWLVDKVKWLGRRLPLPPEVKTLYKDIVQRYPSIYLNRYSLMDNYVTARRMKDGENVRVICHMEHGSPMKKLRADTKWAIDYHNKQNPDDLWPDYQWTEEVEGWLNGRKQTEGDT